VKKSDSGKPAMLRILRELSHSRDLYRAFCDTMEMIALAITNGSDWRQFEKREKRYLEIAGQYTEAELLEVSHFLGHLVDAMETAPGDYLGEMFMELELSNDAKGQFFTPFCISQMMAGLIVDRENVARQVETQGFIRVLEPAVGAGGMILAQEAVMREMGLDGKTHVTAIDVDIKAVHMAYIQLSLAGIPAVVIHGNTLTLEQWSRWYTPIHIWEGWGRKLDRHEQLEALDLAAALVGDAQLDLFGEAA